MSLDKIFNGTSLPLCRRQAAQFFPSKGGLIVGRASDHKNKSQGVQITDVTILNRGLSHKRPHIGLSMGIKLERIRRQGVERDRISQIC